MARWCEFVAAEPKFAQQVRACFTDDRSATVATLRRDGSPRISGTEVMFSDGNLFLPVMFADSTKAADLHRDPRLALHSPTTPALNADMSDWPGDAKIAGYGTGTVIDPEVGWAGFRVDVTEVVYVYFELDCFVIESWHEGAGLRRRERSYPRHRRIEDANYWTRHLLEAGNDV